MDALRALEGVEEVDAVRLPRRIIADRFNPFTYYSESEFMRRYRLRKESVGHILDLITPHLPRVRNRRGLSIPPLLQLLVSVRYMATGNFQISMGDCSDISQASVCQCLKQILRRIAELAPNVIRFPEPGEQDSTIQEFRRIAAMPGVIGCVDGTHIAIASPGGDVAEMYRCRKGYYSLNVQGICDANLIFTNIIASWPGSTHDSRIFNNSQVCNVLEERNDNGYLLGDSGYPCRKYLMTPLLNPVSQKEQRYNSAHKRTRNVIERAFGVWKRVYACLGQLLRTKLETSIFIIVACAVLYNIARRTRVPLLDGHEFHDIRDDDVDNPLALDDEDIDDPPVPIEAHQQANVPAGVAVRNQVIENWF